MGEVDPALGRHPRVADGQGASPARDAVGGFELSGRADLLDQVEPMPQTENFQAPTAGAQGSLQVVCRDAWLGRKRNRNRVALSVPREVAPRGATSSAQSIRADRAATRRRPAIRTVQTSSSPGRRLGPIKATPALSGPRHARASSMRQDHSPGRSASAGRLLSQKPTIPHMTASLTVENQSRADPILLARPAAVANNRGRVVGKLVPARSPLKKGPAYACPTWKNSLSSSRHRFR